MKEEEISDAIHSLSARETAALAKIEEIKDELEREENELDHVRAELLRIRTLTNS